MIALLRGRVMRRTDEMLVIDCGGVGYEVHLPAFLRDLLRADPHRLQEAARSRERPEALRQTGDETVELHISYHVSANQPRPLLVGFLREVEQEFFERFITVDGVGPTKAMKALAHPVERVADAVERKDIAFLQKLPGIGARTAEKIVAALHGKMGKYALLRTDVPAEPEAPPADFQEEVIDVLTRQLGYRAGEARRMVADALRRNGALASAEALLQEVYRVERGSLA
ncbi:MAG TPA: Holliday junction branch migration protein RuvA [bacterium]|nr:Holliday junction branch migration protein RuvA [bacterium]